MADNSSNLNDDLLEINSLDYNMPASLTQCVSNNFTHERFETGLPASGGSTLTHLLNTGKDFVDGDKSYLVLNVKVTGGGYNVGVDYASWGEAGSGLNLISESIVRSRDGKELDRVEGAHIVQNVRYTYENSRDWQRTNGSTVLSEFTDGDATVFAPEDVGAFLESGTPIIIPLKYVSSIFGTGQLLPPQLCSGLSVSIKINDIRDIFYEGGSYNMNLATFEITDAYLRIATCQINDTMTSEVTKIASKEGLKILYDSYYRHRDSGFINSVSANVRANIAQVTGIFAKVRRLDYENDEEVDSQSASGVNQTHYQFRHGSLLMPSNRVESHMEQYHQSMLAFGKMEAEAGLSYKGWFDHGRVVAYNTNRSANLDLAGVSISNSKSLMYDASFGDANPKVLDLYIKYSKLATVFSSNVTVNQ